MCPLSRSVARPAGLRNIDVRRAPSGLLQPNRGMRVLGHGLGREPANLIQRPAPQHRAGPAERRRIPQIVAVLHDAIKQLVFAGNMPELVQISLKRIRRVEVLRRLQQRQIRIAIEPPHRQLQKASRRHVIGVEDRDKRRIQPLQRRIDVARLRVLIVRARHVADARLLGKRAKLLAAPIIEQVNIQLAIRPIDVQRRQRRVLHQPQRLVIGRNQQVYFRPFVRVVRKRHGRAPQRPQRLEVAQQQRSKRIRFSSQHDDDKKTVQPAPRRIVKPEVALHRMHAPDRVPHRRKARQQHQHQRGEIRPRTAVQPQRREHQQAAQHRLLGPWQRHRSRGDEECRPACDDQKP